jgi:hypothetical protein
MKEIILKHGQKVLVDDEDYEWLKNMTWHWGKYITSVYKVGPFVVKRWIMHRLIMGCTDPNLEVDHINHNTRDNRKCNLRVCTSGQNTANRQKWKKKNSKYLGTSLVLGKWTAAIGSKGKKYPLGRFETEEQAALAYNEAAMRIHGEFANLNKVA